MLGSGFKNQNVVIAGGFRGIGFELSKLLLDEGAKVFVIGKTAAHCEELKQTFSSQCERITFFTADLSDEAALLSAQTEVTSWSGGKLHHLVVFLGSGRTPFGHNFPLEHWRKVFDINVLEPIGVTQAFLPLLLHGELSVSITLTGAIAGMERVRAPMTYAVAKTALISYATHLADALVDQGVRVNIISPGNVFYKGGRWEELLREKSDEIEKFLNESVGMKRLGTAEELAQVFINIMSPRNSFMTGQNIVADGLQLRRIF